MIGPSGNKFQDFCTMIGLMSLTWAWAENALALAIGIIDASVPQLRDHSELPVSMKRKLKYLRAALKDIPELKPVEEMGTSLAKRFSELAVRRNELIHGSTWQLGEEEAFESLRFTIAGRQQAAEQKRFDIPDAILLNVEVTKLCDDAAAFLQRVSSIFPNNPGAVR